MLLFGERETFDPRECERWKKMLKMLKMFMNKEMCSSNLLMIGSRLKRHPV